MKPKLLIRPLAREDLKAIWRFTYAEWGVEQADRYLLNIQATLRTLITNPQLGRSVSELRADYRMLPVGKHRAFYVVTEDVEVVRVLHERMDPDAHFSD